jgi:ADP-dependent NAD(P)H-hydrate dehydratase / NAD(P)H-hydrate epimerase
MNTPASILTVAEMTAADRAAIAAGTSGLTLMERAGAAVADAICGRFSPRRTLVLAGPGNNGGDAYVVARLLQARGFEVRLEALSAPRSDDAKSAAKAWGGPVHSLRGTIGDAELVVVGLFGAGLSRPLAGEALRLARLSQRIADRVVAIDLPSGLSGDTGRPIGEAAFHAGLTVTFHRRKIGHVLQPGRDHCGEVVVADIGLGRTTTKLFENEPDLWLAKFPWPKVTAHKHTRGRLIVVSGDAWKTGAARLAARGGLRIGAGLVTLLSPPEALAINAAHLEAVMLAPFETDQDLAEAAEAAEAAVIGPAAGVNDDTLANVLALARTGAALVIDADALTIFREDPEELFSVLDRDDVLTPHPGEFERVFPGLLKGAENKVEAAREAARRAGAVVLIKGADTVVAAPDGRAAVNLNGVPWLATAGSGDTLAGFIGGLLAQGMESFEAACAGVWIHAAAGAAFGPGLISEDLPGLAPRVLADLLNRR